MKIKTILNNNNLNNGYLYDKDEMKRAVDDYIQKLNSNKNEVVMLDELNHPEQDMINIHLCDVSHKITKCEYTKDNGLYVEAECLNTPKGKIIQELLNSNADVSLEPIISVKMEEDFDENENPLGTFHEKLDEIISFDIIVHNTI